MVFVNVLLTVLAVVFLIVFVAAVGVELGVFITFKAIREFNGDKYTIRDHVKLHRDIIEEMRK